MLEKYLYEMDAAYIESLFIKDILYANEIPLTRYEGYLMNSLAEDNLASFSVSLSVDMVLVYKLVDLAQKDMPKMEKIKQVADAGQVLLSQFTYPEKGSEWERYCALVPLWTYCQYVPQILVDIESIAKPGFNYKDCKLENYPDVKEKLDRIVNWIGKEHFPEIGQFRVNLLKIYGEI